MTNDTPKIVYCNGLHLRKIDGVITVFDVDPRDRKYKDFLEIREHWKNSGRRGNRNEGLLTAAEKQFYDFIQNYFREIGLNTEVGGLMNPHGVFLREDETLDVHCEPVPVFSLNPEEGDYQPIITFAPNQKKLSAMTLLAHHKTDWKISILEEILIGPKGKEARAGDGVNKPIITYGHTTCGNGIMVASISQVKRVIEAMSTLHRQIGKEKYLSLELLRCDMERVESSIAKEDLRSRYTSLIDAVLPANLF